MLHNAKLLRTIALGLAVTVCAVVVVPSAVKAEPPHRDYRRDHNFRPDPRWSAHEREVRYYRLHHRHYIAPNYVYAPPPVVYYPPEPSPGINLVVPLHIH